MPIQIEKHARLHRDLFDGKRLLVTRYWPKGVSKSHVDEWHPNLAPSKPLLHAAIDFGRSGPSEIAGERYAKGWQEAYENEMLTQWEAIEDLAHRHLEGETLTLLCTCHDQTTCHRSYLADLIFKAAETMNRL